MNNFDVTIEEVEGEWEVSILYRSINNCWVFPTKEEAEEFAQEYTRKYQETHIRKEYAPKPRIPKKPLCLQCGHRRVDLPLFNHSSYREFFCSIRCAYSFSVDKCHAMQWCDKHDEWYHEDNGCIDCDNDEAREHGEEITYDEV